MATRRSDRAPARHAKVGEGISEREEAGLFMERFVLGAVALGVSLFLVGSVACAAEQVGIKAASAFRPREVKSHNGNRWGLVYRGAIEENASGQVALHPIAYTLNGFEIAANVYTPAGYDGSAAGKYAAVVVAHPNGGVKEQVAGLYAQRLAEKGYVAIAADAAFQGGSGGSPRNTDIPHYRVEDIRGMADIVSRYPGVDSSRIGVLGICGGGGYTLRAAQTDKRLKAVATLSAFNTGVVRRNGFLDSQVATITERLRKASEARAQEAAGGEVLYSDSGSPKLTAEEMEKQLENAPDLYRDGYEYYGKTHAHPNAVGRYTLSGLLELMAFDASENMDLIDQPLLMMAGSAADTFYLTERCFVKAVNARDRELFLIRGATHIQTYWKPEYVEQAVGKLAEFYGKHL